jgi:hypothetical protein
LGWTVPSEGLHALGLATCAACLCVSQDAFCCGSKHVQEPAPVSVFTPFQRYSIGSFVSHTVGGCGHFVSVSQVGARLCPNVLHEQLEFKFLFWGLMP